jgi:hypothetical protein
VGGDQVSVQLHLQDGRWVASCGRCGGRITAADEQADLEVTLAALGVPPLSPVDNEQAIAGAERAYYNEEYGP